MALADTAPVVQKAYELTLWLLPKVEKFPVWPENSIYLKQREIIPGVVDNEMPRCQSAWTRSVSC
jgi:hypothetical protein